MSACEQLTESATVGVAPALRAVDCLSNEAAASAFGRLFGGGGALTPALTIALTLYIAFFAISLLTGRSRIGISALTPRMMTVGLVLTFVTSWVAYQAVVWNLAVGAPDQIAGVLMGAKGSATELFANRIDMVLAAIGDVSENAAATSQGAAAQAGTFSPGNLMWLAALLLLLGTVGVLVTARIALAVLLVLGPAFVVLALFKGTRGLFAGWVRGVVLTALMPLFAVLGGGFTLELAVPIIARLRGAEGIEATAAMAFFLLAAVHVALMSMILNVLGTMVSGWTVFGLGGAKEATERSKHVPLPAPRVAELPLTSVNSSRRSLGLANTVPVALPAEARSASGSAVGARSVRTSVVQAANMPSPSFAIPRQRARGIGSSFRNVSNSRREILR